MMNENYQRTLLMAQLNNKRALKQKYLHQREEPVNQAAAALSGLVMTNIMLCAIAKRVDIFGAIQRIRTETDPNSVADFDVVMGWIADLAEVLDCSPYELFIEDRAKQEKILRRLLQDLKACDSWENIRTDHLGNSSFALPGFDYAYRMTERPSATLLFEKTAGSEPLYRLTLGDGRNALIPGQGVLWQEHQGPLQEFMDGILEELESGWPVLQEQFQQIRQQLGAETETIRDLTYLLQEVPTGLNIAPILTRTLESLRALREKEKIVYGRMPDKLKESGRGKRSQNTLILLGGAISQLERMVMTMPDSPLDQLNDIVYLLENAGEPI